MNKDLLINVGVSIIVFVIIIATTILIIAHMGTIYENLPPPNSTQEWKMILKEDNCKWYNIGCQKLACVIDCQEINRNAGELICVC